MPVADFKTYCAILDRARDGRYALPAANVTSLTTANAVLRGLAESKADGIIQISTGGAAFASGSVLKDMPLGATSIRTVWPVIGACGDGRDCAADADDHHHDRDRQEEGELLRR